jgi:hypothetical protein
MRESIILKIPSILNIEISKKFYKGNKIGNLQFYITSDSYLQIVLNTDKLSFLEIDGTKVFYIEKKTAPGLLGKLKVYPYKQTNGKMMEINLDKLVVN